MKAACGSKTLDKNGWCYVCGYQVDLRLALAVLGKKRERGKP